MRSGSGLVWSDRQKGGTVGVQKFGEQLRPKLVENLTRHRPFGIGRSWSRKSVVAGQDSTMKGVLMPNLRLKFVAIFVTCAALVLGTTPISATPISNPAKLQEVTNPAAPSGVKSAAVVKAVKLVAKGIRKGNKHFANVIKYLDPKATGPFLKHAAGIANVLDDIAAIPDLVLGVVGQKLFSILTSTDGPFKLPGGTANVIKEAIMGAIELAL